MTSDDVLLVLNDLEPVDMSDWVFCVITNGSRYIVGQGRMAGQVIELPSGVEDFRFFRKGELLVLDQWGREPFGEQRKPSKWDIGTAEFGTLGDALACRASVLDGTWGSK